LRGLSGGIPLPPEDLPPLDQPGIYTVVVLAGTPVDAHQPHGKRIAHAVHSVSFAYHV
jgi:hypothetical protein